MTAQRINTRLAFHDGGSRGSALPCRLQRRLTAVPDVQHPGGLPRQLREPARRLRCLRRGRRPRHVSSRDDGARARRPRPLQGRRADGHHRFHRRRRGRQRLHAVAPDELGLRTLHAEGFAGVSLTAGANGAPIGAAAARDSTPATEVLLEPGQAGAATLRYTQARNYPDCTVVPAAGFRIYPPEDTASLFIAQPRDACSNADINLLTIGAFQAQ